MFAWGTSALGRRGKPYKGPGFLVFCVFFYGRVVTRTPDAEWRRHPASPRPPRLYVPSESPATAHAHTRTPHTPSKDNIIFTSWRLSSGESTSDHSPTSRVMV
uniref:Secreted protein n=1 Tax=Knipowitschia caucasica TaxID=637954 RepID=A0AAV2LKC6_KNICA